MADARRGELLALAGAFESSVAKIVQSVGSAAEQLEHAAGSMHRFAHTAGEQSASAAREAEDASQSAMRVSASVSDLSKSILSIAATADQQAQLGIAARGASRTGEEVIRALAERAANIDVFVGLIQGVASQTNMLALNATIEAVRAGDAGRGFEVVAAEVKALANKAHEASGQINQIVSGITSGAAQADDVIGQVSRAMAELEEAATKMRADDRRPVERRNPDRTERGRQRGRRDPDRPADRRGRQGRRRGGAILRRDQGLGHRPDQNRPGAEVGDRRIPVAVAGGINHSRSS